MTVKDLMSLCPYEIKQFFESFDIIFCDCDGVILINQGVIEGVEESLNLLVDMGKTIKFVTNNTSMPKNKMLEIFKMANFSFVDSTCLINPAVAIGSYLNEIKFGNKVFVIGLPGLRHDLQVVGIQIANDPLDVLEEYTIESLKEQFNTVDDEVGAVIICLDFNMTLLALNKAINYLQDPNIHFIITGNDKTIVWKCEGNEKSQICLGAGCIQNMVTEITQRKPLGFGKPLSGLVDFMKKYMKDHDYNPSRVLFIGDSLEQDIAFAKDLEVQTLLVLTGNTKLNDLKFCDKNQQPDYYIDSINQLKTLINHTY